MRPPDGPFSRSADSRNVIALDAGHLCQNPCLACDSIGAGACAITVYDQDDCDALPGVYGVVEFTVYCAAAGLIRTGYKLRTGRKARLFDCDGTGYARSTRWYRASLNARIG